jgi:hypothetical protein
MSSIWDMNNRRSNTTHDKSHMSFIGQRSRFASNLHPGRCKLNRGGGANCTGGGANCSGGGANCTWCGASCTVGGAVWVHTTANIAPGAVQCGGRLHRSCICTCAIWVHIAPKLHRHRCNLDRNVFNLFTFRRNLGANRTHTEPAPVRIGSGLHPHNKPRHIQGTLGSECPSLSVVYPMWHKHRWW